MITLVTHDQPHGAWPAKAQIPCVLAALRACKWQPTMLCGGWPEVVIPVAKAMGLPYNWNAIPAAQVVVTNGADRMVGNASAEGTRLGLPQRHYLLRLI